MPGVNTIMKQSANKIISVIHYVTCQITLDQVIDVGIHKCTMEDGNEVYVYFKDIIPASRYSLLIPVELTGEIVYAPNEKQEEVAVTIAKSDEKFIKEIDRLQKEYTGKYKVSPDVKYEYFVDLDKYPEYIYRRNQQ